MTREEAKKFTWENNNLKYDEIIDKIYDDFEVQIKDHNEYIYYLKQKVSESNKQLKERPLKSCSNCFMFKQDVIGINMEVFGYCTASNKLSTMDYYCKDWKECKNGNN